MYSSLRNAPVGTLVEVPIAPHLQRPVYIRLPTPGQRCPYTGLSRTTLNELTVPSLSN